MWIESQREAESSVSSLLLRRCTVLCVAAVFVVATQVCAAQTTIASKRNHDFYISLMSKSGEFAKKDEDCALFSRTKGGNPTQVENVFVDFAQQVGKIRENPKEFHFSLDSLGRYCGRVDLGKQYYRPAFYYVTVHYTDSLGKRRTCRFFLTMKQ
jgi:hypothetical protein